MLKKKKNIVDKETLQGLVVKKMKPNPDYISYRLDLALGISGYFFGRLLTINSMKGLRIKNLVNENESIIENKSNIDFFTKLQEKKSTDAISYVDVFNGKNNYYGLTPSPQLIAFMKKRVEDYKILARIEAKEDKDIVILLNDYLMNFTNNIIPQFKIGDTVRYTSGYEHIKGSYFTDEEPVFSSGVIEAINSRSGDDEFGKNPYTFVIKGEEYYGRTLTKTTPAPNGGGRKLTKKNNKKKKTRRKLRRKYKKKTQRKKKYTRRRK